jgi:hypothetical protein
VRMGVKQKQKVREAVRGGCHALPSEAQGLGSPKWEGLGNRQITYRENPASGWL